MQGIFTGGIYGDIAVDNIWMTAGPCEIRITPPGKSNI